MVFSLKPVKKANLSLLPQAVAYHGDGQGRDKYVINRFGGTVQNFESSKNTFQNFFGIRDQNLSVNKSPSRTPKEIKTDMAASHLPMFEETIQRYKFYRQRKEQEQFIPKHYKTCNVFLNTSPAEAHSGLCKPSEFAPEDNVATGQLNRARSQKTFHLQDFTNSEHFLPESLAKVKSPKTSVHEQHPTVACTKSLARQKLNSYLSYFKNAPRCKRHESTTCPDSDSMIVNEKLRLNVSNPEEKNMFMEGLRTSNKWSRVSNKSLQYPHIC